VKFFALFFSLSLSASHYDYIYKTQNATAFYNARDKQEFLNLKHQAYGKVVIKAVNPLWLMANIYGGYFVINQIYLCWRPTPILAKPQKEPAVIRTAVSFGALGFFLSQLFSGLIQTTLTPYTSQLQEPFSGFVNSIKNYFMGPPQDEIQKLELKYINKKPQLSPKTRIAIESRFIKERSIFSPPIPYDMGKESPNIRILKQILSLPTGSKPINFSSELFLQEFSAYKDMASTDPLLELERFCRSMSIASKHDNPKLKLPLYLQGPPGVGKTEAVEKLGKVLGIPVIKINLAEFSHIAQIKGLHCEYPEDSRCTPGLIANKLIGQPYKNAILFFDEADQVLNRLHEGQSHEMVSFMLDLLEGKTQFIENPYFNTDLDVRYFGIILAGNSPLGNQALQSRLSLLSFGNYTPEYRIKAGRNRFLPEILQDYAEILKMEDFSPEDLDKIDTFAQTKDPGFREQIRQIERFVHQKAQDSPSTMSSAN
jgi:hypothetical protein